MPKHKTISIRELTKHAERIAADIETSGVMYRIKRSRGKSIVVVDSEYIASLLATIDFMTAHPNWKAELEQADRDYAAGRYTPLDQVLAELGLDAKGRPLRDRAGANRSTAAQGDRKANARAGRARLRAS